MFSIRLRVEARFSTFFVLLSSTLRLMAISVAAMGIEEPNRRLYLVLDMIYALRSRYRCYRILEVVSGGEFRGFTMREQASCVG